MSSADLRRCAVFLALCLAGCERDGGGETEGPAHQGKPLSYWLSQLEAAPERGVRPEDRVRALRAIKELGPGAKEAVPALVRALRDEDAEVRGSAAAALQEIGPEAIPGLVAAVRRGEERQPSYRENVFWLEELVRAKPHIVAVSLVVLALALLATLYQSFKLWIRHRERLARLEKGLDPDGAPLGSTPRPGRS